MRMRRSKGGRIGPDSQVERDPASTSGLDYQSDQAAAGSAVVAAQDIYGATYALLNQLMRSQGVTVRFVDVADLEEVEAACAKLKPVALLVETISNPLLKIADLPALANVAHRHGAALLVDNTFATPYMVQPLSLGTDVVIHSTTKYLGGHGDVLSGIVVTSEERRAWCQCTAMQGVPAAARSAWSHWYMGLPGSQPPTRQHSLLSDTTCQPPRS